MEPSKRRRLTLIALALSLPAILFLLPATGWLVRTQIREELLSTQEKVDTGALEAVARQHPGDYQLQYALVLASPDYSQAAGYGAAVLPGLRALTARFPDQPGIYANTLRYMTSGEITGTHRDEEDPEYGSPGWKRKADAALPAATPEKLAAFDQAAAEGERVDPDNAYFPFMRAIGLFAAHRDPEAVAAVVRAGAKPRWDDYVTDDIIGRERLYTLAFGQQPAIARLTWWAAVLYPHYAGMRSVARMATYEAIESEREPDLVLPGPPVSRDPAYEAIQAERKVDIDQGLAIRHALMRYGSLMRVHSRSLIGSLVGIAITAIGANRPGGAPYIKPDPNHPLSGNQSAKLRRDRYLAYLHRVGRDDEARWAESELDTALQAKAIANTAVEHMPLLDDVPWLGLLWILDQFTLSNLLALFALGGAAFLAVRLRPQKHVRPLRVIFGIAVAAALFLWQWRVFAPANNGMLSAVTSFNQMAESANSVDTDSYPLLAGIFVLAMSLSVPTILLMILVGTSWRYRVPLSTGIGRGLRGLALPIACGLLLLYGGLVLGTLHQEALVNHRNDQTIQHEGRYLAECVGKTWPGL